MVRLIKRYESRKLYDLEESRYVSLEEISGWVREGQEIRVVDNTSSNDVTAQTLTQIILDEGKKGTSFLPSELLHDLIRLGERAVSSGVETVHRKVEGLFQASIDRLGPVREAREEMTRLRERLERLEGSLAQLETPPASLKKAATGSKASSRKTTKRKAPAQRKTAVPASRRRKASAEKKEST